MAYRDFTFPKVVADLALTSAVGPLFPSVPAVAADAAFAARLRRGAALAVAVSTEKARSEFMIAPVLDEARRLLEDRPALFSGVEFNVDPARGLNGYCDFLISRDPMTYMVTAPVVAVAEGKNGIARDGYGQCVAGMVAVREFNAAAGVIIPRVYGISTNGAEWKLMRLTGAALTIDADDYYIDDPGRLLGVLCHLIEHG